MKPKPIPYPARLALITVLSLALSGCQLSLPYKGTTQETSIVDSNNTVTITDAISDSPQKTFNSKDSGGEVPVVNAIADEAKENSPNAQTESTTAAGKTPPISNAKDEKKWDAQAPRLHGIAVGDTKTTIDSKFGKADDTYTLDDEDETLTINEYDTFSVGFGKNKKVKFIEVFDRKAVTDLNGLRVGDNESAAVKALGKPDTHTASVLAYKAKGSMLKLDLDPDHNDIISIKLFLNTEKA